MSRPRAFYYEDYDTKYDPVYLYHKSEADREFLRLEQIAGLVPDLLEALVAWKEHEFDNSTLSFDEVQALVDAAIEKAKGVYK